MGRLTPHLTVALELVSAVCLMSAGLSIIEPLIDHAIQWQFWTIVALILVALAARIGSDALRAHGGGRRHAAR